MNKALPHDFPVIVLLGLSGAGKSTALHVFEDINYFTVDGLPPELLPETVRQLQSPFMAHYRGMVFGMDALKGTEEDVTNALEALGTLEVRPFLLFVEADQDVLVRRYATTRRPHPLEKSGLNLEQALAEERRSLQSLRARADLLLDTSSFSIHDLRRVVQHRWNRLADTLRTLRINLVSFGFKYGVPKEADLVFDVRFLPNPYFVETLRPLSGLDSAIADYVFEQENAKEYLERLFSFLEFSLPFYNTEGRYRLSIGIGCTGGRHRSVALAEALGAMLKKTEFSVTIEHRHLELG